MARGYLGKISAVVAINTGGVKPSLNNSAKDIQSWGRTVQSRLSGTSEAAKRAIDGIFTPLQKLQAAVNAANRNPLNLGVPNVRAYLDLARAIEQIGKPLGNTQKQFTSLSQGVQSQLLPAFRGAQKQATQLFDAISSGSRVSERDFANTEARINRVTQAIARASEASQAVRGLANGQELRFQNPEFLRSTGRAAALQQQAAALSPEDIAGRGVVALVGQQRQAADEAERLRSAIERITITRRGDAQAAQQAYSQQLAALERVNDELQQQIALANNASGAARAAAARQGVFDNRELDRRSGVLARRNANNFEDATAGLLGPRNAQAEMFARETEAQARARELSRTTELRGQFVALPPAVQQSLEQERAALNSIANAARDGAAGVETLAQANDRMAQSIASATSRLEEQAAAARQQAMQAANQRLNVLQEDSSPIEGLASQLTGRNDPSRRVLEQLGGSIDSVRNRIRGVGESLAGDVGPIVDNLTTRFQNMARQGIGFTAQEARRLAQEVAGVASALDARQAAADRFGASFGGVGRAGLGLGVDERSLRSIGGQIEFVQGRLAGLAQEARGPVIAALDALRVRAQQLFEGGALDTTEGRRELQLLREELVRTLSAAGGGSERRIANQLERVGDVARGAFGNAGLAIQQAAFAFEDFFSVTGGLDQRIRAAGNNISQLGFILGGTTGLIVGISTAIGAQLVAALIRWYNEGRTSEDQVKSLNDALARQKTLVEDLKQAFESLGDSIARKAFSAPAQQAREFAKSLDEITKKQKESREKRLADLDPYVQRERAEQSRIQRELEAEQDPNRRLALQRDLRRAQRGERAVTEGLIAGAPTTQRDRDRAIAGLERVLTDVNDRTFRDGGVGRPVARDQAQQLIASIQGGSAANQAAQLRAQQQGIENEARSGRLSRQTADIAIAQLELVINRIDFAAAQATDELAVRISKSSIAASLSIESAQQDVADAIRRGVEGAAEFQAGLDNLARQLDEAQTQLRNAQEIEDPAAREAAVRQAEGRVRDIRVRQDAINEAARAVRLGRTFGGERTTAALSALQNNERFANEFAGLTARLAAAADAELAAQEEYNRAIAGGNEAAKQEALERLNAAKRSGEVAAATAEAALAMEQAVARLRKLAQGALSQSEQIADNAQRQLTDRPTDANRQARDNAERQLIDDRRRVAQANNAIDRRRAEAQTSDPRLVQINSELEAITQERKRLEAEAAINNTTLDPAEAQRLADREAQLLAEREARLYDLTEAERRQVDAINEEIAARRRAIEFLEEVDRRRRPQGDPIRGLDLLERPGERAARELRQANADIEAATRSNVALAIKEGRFGDIAGIQLREEEAKKRAREASLRQNAPAVFALADAVTNALLQGPSRAALQPTDVSTVEGSRELTRLLRGEDAARDQANLVELQKEANRLLDIIANNPADIAN